VLTLKSSEQARNLQLSYQYFSLARFIVQTVALETARLHATPTRASDVLHCVKHLLRNLAVRGALYPFASFPTPTSQNSLEAVRLTNQPINQAVH
jgi:hypothetical protein